MGGRCKTRIWAYVAVDAADTTVRANAWLSAQDQLQRWNATALEGRQTIRLSA
jgi:hypothetical protein